MVEERQIWEHKYEAATEKQSQEIAGLKFRLRAKTIEQAEHMDYIILLREQDVSKTVEYERLLRELGRDNEDWKTQCMARQIYIKHETKQLFKTITKAHEMWDKAEALRQEFIPTGRNGQQLLNFIEEAKDHYKQVNAFYGYNCNMLNAM